MQDIKPCPFCGSKKVRVGTYYESTDGKSDTPSFVSCEKCGAKVSLTVIDIRLIERQYKYKGGYYTDTPNLLEALNKEPIDKWNRRV